MSLNIKLSYQKFMFIVLTSGVPIHIQYIITGKGSRFKLDGGPVGNRITAAWFLLILLGLIGYIVKINIVRLKEINKFKFILFILFYMIYAFIILYFIPGPAITFSTFGICAVFIYLLIKDVDIVLEKKR